MLYQLISSPFMKRMKSMKKTYLRDREGTREGTREGKKEGKREVSATIRRSIQ